MAGEKEKKNSRLLTISNANNGLSVPEQTVATLNGLLPKCSNASPSPSSSALLVINRNISSRS